MRTNRVTFAMSLSLVGLMAVSIFLPGCSSTQEKPNPEVAALEAAHDRIAREIAAASDTEQFEKEFQAMLADQFPGRAFSQEARRLAGIFFRAQGHLNDYDAKLAAMAATPDQHNARELIVDDSYAALISSWILREQSHAKLIYLYLRANEMSLDDGNRSKEARAIQDKAMDARRSMRVALMRVDRNNPDRLALGTMIGELLEASKTFKEGKSQSRDAALESAMSRYSMSASEAARFYTQNKKAIQNRIEEAKKDTDVNAAINALAIDVKQTLATNFEQRTPQAAGDAVPSSGPNGNLTGNTFRQGRWALTYDDGPSTKSAPNNHTMNILKNLENNGIKATFFWLAQNTSKMATPVREAQRLGMDLANHSYTHANLPKLSSAGVRKEVVESNIVHQQAFGAKPKLFRCPYGACGGGGSAIRQLIAQEGMVHVFWNVDSLDWQDKNPSSLAKRVRDAMKVAKKGILLFHDIHPQTESATATLMKEWKTEIAAGRLRFLTVAQAVEELNTAEGMK